MRALILILAMLATPTFAQDSEEENRAVIQAGIEKFNRTAPESMSRSLKTYCTIKTIGQEPAMQDCMLMGVVTGNKMIAQAKEKDLSYEIIFDFCVPKANGDMLGAYACYVEGLRAFLNAHNVEKATESQGVTTTIFDHCWRKRPDFLSVARCARIEARRAGVTLQTY